ncbi:MAG: hypothetical protein V4475_01760 [Pseudomonadota bacterium]
MICDVPGCGCTRPRRFRLCDRCFARLPGEYRVGIAEAHHQRRFADWTALRRRAAQLLGLATIDASVGARIPRITPQRSYELQARMLGERLDS